MSEGTAALTGSAPVGDNGAGAEGSGSGAIDTTGTWMEGFDEDTSAYVRNKGWDSPQSLLDSYRNLEKFQGGSKNLVEIPGVDATDDVMSNFYDQLGRPGSPEQYGFELPDGGDEGLMSWFAETAHRHGLSQKQAQSLFADWNEMSASRIDNMQHEMKVANERAIDNLKREWGQEFEGNLNAGQRAVAALGYDEQALSSLEDKMGTAEMMKLFSTIGAKMGEDSFVDGSGSEGFGTSPAQARHELNDLKADSQFMDKYLKGDKAAISKMQRLMDLAYGG